MRKNRLITKMIKIEKILNVVVLDFVFLVDLFA